MSDFLTDFEWFKCPNGCRLVENGSSSDPPIDGGGSRRGDHLVVCNGVERITYRPLKEFENLFCIFAMVSTPDHLIDFVKKFGPLTRGSLGEGDSVTKLLLEAEFFRNLLRAKQSGPRKLATFYEAKVAEIGGNRSIARLQVIADSTKGLRIVMDTEDLLDALWWQLMRKLSDNSKILECRYCKEWFEAGPAAGRRADDEFCRDEHRIRFNSLRRSRAK